MSGLAVLIRKSHKFTEKRLILFTAFVTLTILLAYYQLFYSPNIHPQPQYNISTVNQTNDNCKRKNLTTAVEERNCSVKIKLPDFYKHHSQKMQMFFLETSGRPFLKGRQVCSVESAAIQSGLISKVIMRSSYLDLSKRKSFCDLFHNYKNVQFYTINYEELFRLATVFLLMFRRTLFDDV